MTIEKLKLLVETSFENYPDASVEKFVRDGIAEYDQLVKKLKVVETANEVLIEHNTLLQSRHSDVIECMSEIDETDVKEEDFDRILFALGES